MRAHGVLLILAALLAGGAGAQTGTPNPIDIVRGAQDYRLSANLFPQTGAQYDPERDRVMTASQQDDAGEYLNLVFDVQKDVLAKQSASVMHALEIIGVQPVARTTPVATRIEFVDDQVAWSQTLSVASIRLGARFLRGLQLGSLQETVSGQAASTQILGSLLGQGAHQRAISEIEARTRLFFAAARRGVSEIRTQEDMDEHAATVRRLLKQYLGGGNKADVSTDLEARLRSAAEGGPISGTDGMAMFDIFMNLTYHFNPAIEFVLGHELGHVVLGHAPFPPDLSCAEKQVREDDADAFALTLLVYDTAGEFEASGVALAALELPSDDTLADVALRYGYHHAIRYGFSLAGSSNEIGDGCAYRTAADRIARLDGLRRKLIELRADAVQSVFRHFRKHPPYVHTSEDVEGMSAAKRHKLATLLSRHCLRDGPLPKAGFRKVSELPFGWVLPCSGRTSKIFGASDFQLRLGVNTAQEVIADYERHSPTSSLLDGAVVKKLTGRP